MATHSSILAWRIPWTEPGRLWFIGLQELDTTERLSTHARTHACTLRGSELTVSVRVRNSGLTDSDHCLCTLAPARVTS